MHMQGARMHAYPRARQMHTYTHSHTCVHSRNPFRRTLTYTHSPDQKLQGRGHGWRDGLPVHAAGPDRRHFVLCFPHREGRPQAPAGRGLRCHGYVMNGFRLLPRSLTVRTGSLGFRRHKCALSSPLSFSVFGTPSSLLLLPPVSLV